MKYLKLNNGVEMPQIGLGTFLIPKEKLSHAIAEAYEMGYRQFDTAWRYYNETEIAKALKENGINRQDVFITTKINRDAFYFRPYKVGKRRIFNIPNLRSVRSVIQESFDNLNTDYIDLFLLHWPYPMSLSQKMYKEMTRFYNEGRIRAIGVCSSLPNHFEAYKEVSDVIPAVNQFEISPLNTQKDLIKWNQERGIVVEAMSTFSHFRSNEPRKEIIENPIILNLAQKYSKSSVQIILRWLVQQNIAIIPKTWNPRHLEENISLDDFCLTKEDMQAIDTLNQGRYLNYDPYATWNLMQKRFRHTVSFD